MFKFVCILLCVLFAVAMAQREYEDVNSFVNYDSHPNYVYGSNYQRAVESNPAYPVDYPQPHLFRRFNEYANYAPPASRI
ncbi:hypothetical protein HHI36_020418 [Cryptolaemus montrouzieri]|uniref:Uncharacterized protein n=1 Tax=Cryptolaemus montrouzieri TaxID=559131 RepID=A0ABD2NAX4_9CUCU